MISWILVTISEICRYVSAGVARCWGFCEWAKLAYSHYKWSYKFITDGDQLQWAIVVSYIRMSFTDLAICHMRNKVKLPNQRCGTAIWFLARIISETRSRYQQGFNMFVEPFTCRETPTWRSIHLYVICITFILGTACVWRGNVECQLNICSVLHNYLMKSIFQQT